MDLTENEWEEISVNDRIDELVSVIIPVHNSEKYLAYCVSSILKQTYLQLEILLVENGSEDNSYSRCIQMKAQDERIRVYHLKEAGVSRARNYGVQKARGQYILFVDSDDYCEDTYCERMICVADRSENNCMPICGMRIVKGYDYEGKADVCYGTEGDRIVPRDFVLKVFKKGLLNSLWNKVYIRDIIVSKNIIMREDLTLGEDLLFNLEYFKEAEIESFYMLNEPLYNYVKSGKESLDNRYYPDMWELTNLFLDSICDYCRWGDIKEPEMIRNIVYFYYIDLFDNTMREENKETFWGKIKQNDQIMQDEHFKLAVSGNIDKIQQFELWIARSGRYFPYYVMKRIKRVIGRILRRG